MVDVFICSVYDHILTIKLFLLILRIVGLQLDSWDEWVVNGRQPPSSKAKLFAYKLYQEEFQFPTYLT